MSLTHRGLLKPLHSCKIRLCPRHVRPVPAAVLEEVRALVGDVPRRDLLIEYLHRIQDAYGCIDVDRLAALAQLLKLSRAEVFWSLWSLSWPKRGC